MGTGILGEGTPWGRGSSRVGHGIGEEVTGIPGDKDPWGHPGEVPRVGVPRAVPGLGAGTGGSLFPPAQGKLRHEAGGDSDPPLAPPRGHAGDKDGGQGDTQGTPPGH